MEVSISNIRIYFVAASNCDKVVVKKQLAAN
jgi:hypothetical protein